MGRYEDFITSIRDERPLNCKFDNSEQHHIIPRCIGGSDDADNLIYLTYQEHFTAHRLLAEDNADKANNIKAGDNVAWTGTEWDVLSGVVDLSAYTPTAEFIEYTNSEVQVIWDQVFSA